MQVKIEERESECISYPWIGRSKNDYDLIVLFASHKTGIVLQENYNYEEGEFRDDWIENNFDLFNGEIRLSNG